MKGLSFGVIGIFLTGLILVWLPATANAQTEQINAASPAIGQKLVREGDFAVKLETALGVGTSKDEAEAESRLTDVGISPRNGWIADYPVTPDIIDELYKSVHDAAEANTISMSVEMALQRMDGIMAETGLGVNTGSRGSSNTPISGTTNYPNATEINNYYYNEGPPVVTYYTPPPDYYYLYGWVPYPFWWGGFWFSGFFILNDFHQVVVVDHFRRRFISNHFTDVRNHRVTRIDPVARFDGRSLRSGGVSNSSGFTSTNIPRRDRAITNTSRTPAPPAIRNTTPARSTTPAFIGNGNRRVTPAIRSERSFNTPAVSGTTVSMPNRGNDGGRPFTPTFRSGGSSTRDNSMLGTSGRSSVIFSTPSRGSAPFSSGFTRGGGFGGRGRR